MKQRNNILLLVALLVFTGVVTSCARDNNNPGIQFAPEMYESIPYEPFKQVMDSTSPFRDGQTMQIPPEGTISRTGHASFPFPPGDSVKQSNAELIAYKNPITLTAEALAEGEILYARFCGVCHGSAGAGNGKVAQHDAINPVAYNSTKLKGYTAGQLYHTIMYGQGVMGSYASQLDHDERWKVVHFVQTLQGDGSEAATDSTATPVGDAADDAPVANEDVN